MPFEKVIEAVPTYEEFLSVKELQRHSKHLAENHPNLVDRFKIGESERGRELHALKVGNGEYTAILIGFPHPNEPIGSLTCDMLSQQLAEDDDLRENLDFTWYFIKAADIDGAILNEGWFKGKYDTMKHMLNFYRTPGNKQIEWSYPVSYKNFTWDTPAKETQSIMHLMEEVKPDFVYSLHNSAFGGVYFYVSDPCARMYQTLHDLVRHQDLPLHLGEPESPYMKKLNEAIFYLPDFEEIYDYYLEHSDKDPATFMKRGGSSKDYSKRVSNAFLTICEMPYIFDEQIVDTSPTNTMRRTAYLEKLQIQEEMYNRIKDAFEAVKESLVETSPFFEVIDYYLDVTPPIIEARRRWATTDEALERKATVSELFDNRVVSKYYGMRMVGQFIRLLKESIEATPSANEELKQLKNTCQERLTHMNKEVERNTDLQEIPIQKLVRVQVGTAVHMADYVKTTYRA